MVRVCRHSNCRCRQPHEHHLRARFSSSRTTLTRLMSVCPCSMLGDPLMIPGPWTTTRARPLRSWPQLRWQASTCGLCATCISQADTTTFAPELHAPVATFVACTGFVPRNGLCPFYEVTRARWSMPLLIPLGPRGTRSLLPPPRNALCPLAVPACTGSYTRIATLRGLNAALL